jgi:hypothetical protein
MALSGSSELTLGHLMDSSEERLDTVAHAGTMQEQHIAARLRDNPLDYRRWELEHSGHMERVLKATRPALQANALLSLGFSLTHRTALFEFLRTSAMRGRQRRALVAHFHGGHSYTQAIVAEHGNYLRSSASLICVEHIGSTILKHPAIGDPLHEYQQAYAEYFRNYCHSAIMPASMSASDTTQPLLPALKFDLHELRTKLLAMPVQPAQQPTRARGAANPGSSDNNGGRSAKSGSAKR